MMCLSYVLVNIDYRKRISVFLVYSKNYLFQDYNNYILNSRDFIYEIFLLIHIFVIFFISVSYVMKNINIYFTYSFRNYFRLLYYKIILDNI